MDTISLYSKFQIVEKLTISPLIRKYNKHTSSDGRKTRCAQPGFSLLDMFWKCIYIGKDSGIENLKTGGEYAMLKGSISIL